MAGKLSCLIRDPPQKSVLFPQHETATGGGGHHVKFIRISMLLVGTRVSQVHTTYTGHQPPTVNVLRRGSHKCSLEWKYSTTPHPQLQGKESRRRRNYEPRQDNNETMYYLLVIIFENFPRHFLLDLPTAAQHHERRYFSISTSSSPSTHSPSVYGVPEERIKVGLCNNINKIENNPSCCWEWQSGGTC